MQSQHLKNKQTQGTFICFGAGKHQITNSKKLRNTAATTEYFLSPWVTNFYSSLATDFRVNSVLGGFLCVILRLLMMPNICGG